MKRWSLHSCPASVLLAIHTLLWSNGVFTFLLDGPRVQCPQPATNCLQEIFNRVFEHLGCLGCQSGCQPGYIMTANPRYHVTEGDVTGFYDYQNITIPKTRNVSEPEWLCLPGDSCPWGFFASKIDVTDACSYCGEGCRSCQSYDNCDHCVMGYKLTKTQLPNGREASLCVSTGVECPNPPDNCQHKTYVSQIVGCQGCMFCEDGYLPTYNPSYRRPTENQTGMYQYQGIRITGSLEVWNLATNAFRAAVVHQDGSMLLAEIFSLAKRYQMTTLVRSLLCLEGATSQLHVNLMHKLNRTRGSPGPSLNNKLV